MDKKCILINQERRQSIIEYIQNNYKCNIFYNGEKTVYLTCKIFNHSFVIRISDHYHSKLNWSGIDLILRPGAKRIRIKTQYKGEFSGGRLWNGTNRDDGYLRIRNKR